MLFFGMISHVIIHDGFCLHRRRSHGHPVVELHQDGHRGRRPSSWCATGRLTLDKPLPDQAYTLRQLLAHRAGLTNYGGLPAYHEAVDRHDDAWSAAEMLERARADRLIYQPGGGWGLFQHRVFLRSFGSSRRPPETHSVSPWPDLSWSRWESKAARVASNRGGDLANRSDGGDAGLRSAMGLSRAACRPPAGSGPPPASAHDRRSAGALHSCRRCATPTPVGGPVPGASLGLAWVRPRTDDGRHDGRRTFSPVTPEAGLEAWSGSITRSSSPPARTAAAFSPGSDQGTVETPLCDAVEIGNDASTRTVIRGDAALLRRGASKRDRVARHRSFRCLRTVRPPPPSDCGVVVP